MKNNPRNLSLLSLDITYISNDNSPPPPFFSVEPAMCEKILRQRHDAGSTARKSRGSRRGGKNTVHTYRLARISQFLLESLETNIWIRNL